MESTSHTPEFPKKRSSLVVKLLLGFGILLFLAVLAVAWWRSSLTSKNAARLKAITDAGEPASARELDASYMHVDDEENAALVWLGGISKLKPPLLHGQTPPWFDFRPLPLGERFDQPQLDRASAILVSNAEALGIFHRAALMPKSRYPVDLSQSTYAKVPYLSPLKASGELLKLAALSHAHGGRGRESAEALGDILGAARTLFHEPLQISQTVRVGLDLLAVSTTERVIHLTPLAETELAQLQAAFAQAEDSNACARALAGERACIITLLNAPDEMDPPTDNPQFERDVNGRPRALVRLTGFYQRELGFFLDVMSNAIATSQLDDPQRFINRPDDNTFHEQARKGLYVLASVVTPSLQHHVEMDVEHRATLRVAQAGMAIERYRLAHDGRLPNSLDELVPKYLSSVPIDPFDGAPIHFKVHAPGYVVYSFGIDGRDDGGKTWRGNRRSRQQLDVTFTMEK